MSDDLGLRVLDEPCANQSEPAVLYLQLRANTKQTSAKPVVIFLFFFFNLLFTVGLLVIKFFNFLFI